jgi:hypothetical protein
MVLPAPKRQPRAFARGACVCSLVVKGLEEPEAVTGPAGDERPSDGLDDRFVRFAPPVDTEGAITLAGSDLKLTAVARAEFFPQFCADKSFGRTDGHDFGSREKGAAPRERRGWLACNAGGS